MIIAINIIIFFQMSVFLRIECIISDIKRNGRFHLYRINEQLTVEVSVLPVIFLVLPHLPVIKRVARPKGFCTRIQPWLTPRSSLEKNPLEEVSWI